MTELSKFERETIICFNEGESNANIYTHNKALKNKLARLAQENPQCVPEKVTPEAASYIVPKSWVKVSKPRVMSDEQRQAASERLKKARGYETNAEGENICEI